MQYSRDRRERDKDEGDGLKEKLIFVNRVAKVVKGGRRFSFGALVVVGDGQGSVGLGYGKANEVAEAIRKAVQSAKNNMKKVPIMKGTIPFGVTAQDGAAKVFMKPATPGTGIIAGGAVRAVVESAGIKDILTKNLGTKNPLNAARATMKGLQMLRTPEQHKALRERLREDNKPQDDAAAKEEQAQMAENAAAAKAAPERAGETI